jgi:hypothetical protein
MIRLSIFFLYSCCSHSEHRASLKRFISLQFLNPETVGRTPWTGDLSHAMPLPNINRHPCLECDSNPRSGEDSSCLRPRRHYDRLCIHHRVIKQVMQMIICTEEESWDVLSLMCRSRPPLWSSAQSSWLQIPALPGFLRSSGSGTGSTQAREDN